jgi:hypothetical protein
MKKLLFLVFLVSNISYAQTGNKKFTRVYEPGYTVLGNMKGLHQMMVEKKNERSIGFSGFLHDSLIYGHSNGWMETKTEFMDHLENDFIVYHSFSEDSIQIVEEGNTATVRFIADIDATLNGKRVNFHLKVLEVWVRKKDVWQLLARQAVKG